MPEDEPIEDVVGEEEENVITKDEFRQIEDQEGGGPEIEEIEEVEGEEIPEEASEVEKLTMRIDKLEARMDVLKEEREAFQEQIQELSGEIGELRSSLMERERDFDKLEKSFEKIEGLFSEIEPEEFVQKLDKKEEEIKQNEAKIESTEEQIDVLQNRIKKINNKLKGIKDIENLTKFEKKINDKLDEAEENKEYIERKAGRIEDMFSELSDKLNKFESYTDKIDTNKETMTELMRTVDKIDVQMENSADEDNLDELEEELKEEINSLKTDTESKVYEMSDLLDELMENISKKDLDNVASEYKEANELANRLMKENKKIKKRQKMILSLLKKMSGVDEDQ